jgi:PAS domain S-box-containing protein
VAIRKRVFIQGLVWALIFAGLYLTSLLSEPLFHGLAEIFRIAVAAAIFLLVWNVRRSMDNSYLMFLGVAYVFVAALDIIHALASQGMGIFPGSRPNLAAQLWISALYLESISLLAASFFVGRKLRLERVLGGYGLAIALLLGSIFAWHVFPVCYAEGVGLTPFKRLSEVAISLILAAALGALLRKGDQFDRGVLRLLAASIGFTLASELFVVAGAETLGFPFLVVHFFKIVAVYCLYRAIFETGMAKPLTVLFRNLKQSEDALRRASEDLEHRVRQRTADLARANELLMKEIQERRRAEEELRRSETKYRTVSENTYDWEWWVAPGGDFIYVSPSCRRITLYEPEEFVRDPDFLLKIVHPDDRPSFIKHMTEIEEKILQGEIEFRILRPDRTIRWLAHACQPVFDEQGRLLGRRGSNRDITERKRAEQALRESEKELRRLSARILTAQETERRRISRELHDELGGALAVLKIRTSFIEKKLTPGQDDAKAECRHMLEYIDQIIENVSRLSRDLSPSVLEDIGLTPALRRLIDNAGKVHGVQIVSDISNVERFLPKESHILVYRIFQEALTNIGKHAQAKNVSVQVRKDGDRISLFVEDDGRGFDPDCVVQSGASERGLGLATMNERARMLGGALDLKSEEGRGTRIALSIPIAGKEEAS